MKKSYFTRHDYLESIKPFLGKNIIKVITGMRRVGKSYFLKQLQDYWFARGIDEKHFLLVDMESHKFDAIRDYKDLIQYVDKHFEHIEGQKILFVDEVQEIEQWEKAIRSYFNNRDIDIVITGSNAQLLASEIATHLSGRTIEFNMYPFSFSEFLAFNEITDKQAGLVEYLRFGGMPSVYDFHLSDTKKRDELLRSIFNTIILKDVVGHYNIRNVKILENLIRFAFDNIGNIFSAKKIAEFLKSQHIQVTVDTITNYLKFLEDAYALHRAGRYDIKGKRHFEINEKYYVADLGIRHAIIGYHEHDVGAVLENVIYLELKRRGFEITIGKLGTKEIDFIAESGGKKIYIQVAFSLATQEVINREFNTLSEIDDNFPKYVISMDAIFSEQIKGVQWINAIDFLLKHEI